MMDFKVTPDNGEVYEVTAKARDIVTWENLDKTNSLTKLYEGVKFNDLYTIAFLASVRTGKYTGTLSDFKASCDLDFEEEEAPLASSKEATQEA